MSKKEKNRLRVIGPFFSGSAVSLRMALTEARTQLKKHEKSKPWTPEPLIQVVSGSASGFDYDRFCRDWFKEGQRSLAFQAHI